MFLNENKKSHELIIKNENTKLNNIDSFKNRNFYKTLNKNDSYNKNNSLFNQFQILNPTIKNEFQNEKISLKKKKSNKTRFIDNLYKGKPINNFNSLFIQKNNLNNSPTNNSFKIDQFSLEDKLSKSINENSQSIINDNLNNTINTSFNFQINNNQLNISHLSNKNNYFQNKIKDNNTNKILDYKFSSENQKNEENNILNLFRLKNKNNSSNDFEFIKSLKHKSKSCEYISVYRKFLFSLFSITNEINFNRDYKPYLSLQPFNSKENLIKNQIISIPTNKNISSIFNNFYEKQNLINNNHENIEVNNSTCSRFNPCKKMDNFIRSNHQKINNKLKSKKEKEMEINKDNKIEIIIQDLKTTLYEILKIYKYKKEEKCKFIFLSKHNYF